MKKHVLLVAEDDANDALLLERALRRSSSCFQMVRVCNGEELIDYVSGKGVFRDRTTHPIPDVVLLDLKMPRKDGFDVLRWRQETVGGTLLPMIVFSSSNLRKDIERAYSLGANSYVVKSATPDRMKRMVDALQEWWLEFNVTLSPTQG